jgi:hypothetical protein
VKNEVIVIFSQGDDALDGYKSKWFCHYGKVGGMGERAKQRRLAIGLPV